MESWDRAVGTVDLVGGVEVREVSICRKEDTGAGTRRSTEETGSCKFE